MIIRKNFEFVDGGLKSNCPMNEGIELLGDTSASCLISIGCDVADAERGGFKLGGIYVGIYAINIIADAQKKWDFFYLKAVKVGHKFLLPVGNKWNSFVKFRRLPGSHTCHIKRATCNILIFLRNIVILRKSGGEKVNIFLK